MPPIRNYTPSTRRGRLLALAASLLLAGYGATLLLGTRSDAVTQSVAEAALTRVKAPPGFHVGKCEFRPTGSNDRCYRRKPFVALDTARFTALITASGLTEDRSLLTPCLTLAHRRPRAAIAWNACTARANRGSVEFAVSATSVKILRRNALPPRDLKVARSLRSTVYEVTLITTGAGS
jgi:hypothetical protein